MPYVRGVMQLSGCSDITVVVCRDQFQCGWCNGHARTTDSGPSLSVATPPSFCNVNPCYRIHFLGSTEFIIYELHLRSIPDIRQTKFIPEHLPEITDLTIDSILMGCGGGTVNFLDRSRSYAYSPSSKFSDQSSPRGPLVTPYI